MLRAIDEKQGIGIYTQNLMAHLLEIDKKNEYVLFYRNPKFLGWFGDYPHVKEILVNAPNKAIWDQVKIPLEARRENVDVIFHTKFTVPFLTTKKTLMTLHGASWFTRPELYKSYDVLYVRALMPFYCRKATAILSNSELTTQDFIEILGVHRDKIRTTHLAPHDRFKQAPNEEVLNRVRTKYRLPNRFILSVIKYDPRKNFKNLIEGFWQCRQRVDCKLVVVGIGCDKYRKEYRLEEKGIAKDVLFLGWIDQEELPSIYHLADGLLFPSVYEEFGIPVSEAMACSCPVIVSNTGALPEISGEAGILVDPMNPVEIGQALYRVWTDESFRNEMKEKSIKRSQYFSWEKCARETLEVLEGMNVGRC